MVGPRDGGGACLPVLSLSWSAPPFLPLHGMSSRLDAELAKLCKRFVEIKYKPHKGLC